MMVKMRIICFLLILPFLSCSASEEEPFVNKQDDPVDGIRIAWDYSSMQCLAPIGGYPRIKKLIDNSLIVVYDASGNGVLRRSFDGGTSWSEPVNVFKQHTYTNKDGLSTTVNIANSELIQLQNGDLVAACNFRPSKDEIAPFAIVIRRSKDLGVTWSEEQILYEGGPRFTDGCWEPSFLQLPNGDLQVYFANESPYRNSDEQEISVLTSHDNGMIWDKDIKTVSFRAGHRDGMPVAIISGNDILVSIEDNKVGQFKPYIVRNSISDNWKIPVSEDSPLRESALLKPLAENIYAGAPYLLRIPTGEILMSYQTTGQRSSNWELSTMEVSIGDKSGRNFSKATRPFDVPFDKEAKWNSLSLLDNKTVAAVASTNAFTSSVGVWMIKGHILSDVQARKNAIILDGDLSQNEWGDDFPLFVGSKGKSNIQSGICYDENNMYISVAAHPNGDLINQLSVYLDPENNCVTMPDKGIYRIDCKNNGNITLNEGDKGGWKMIDSKQITAKVKTGAQQQYTLEISIPFSVLHKIDRKPMRINLMLETSMYKESLTNSTPESTGSWMKVVF
ncbi:MAG: hypothetical protein H6Q12_107 [Bacteroidetes bacterium]|nr:hypothetical protein [Bacteroidota bacterium]